MKTSKDKAGSDVGRMREHHTLTTLTYLDRFASRRLLQASIGQLLPRLWPMASHAQCEHRVHYYFSLHIEEADRFRTEEERQLLGRELP